MGDLPPIRYGVGGDCSDAASPEGRGAGLIGEVGIRERPFCGEGPVEPSTFPLGWGRYGRVRLCAMSGPSASAKVIER